MPSVVRITPQKSVRSYIFTENSESACSSESAKLAFENELSLSSVKSKSLSRLHSNPEVAYGTKSEKEPYDRLSLCYMPDAPVCALSSFGDSHRSQHI